PHLTLHYFPTRRSSDLVIPGYGGTQRLPRLIGKGRASQLIFSAEMINADTAEKWGLVNKVVPISELINEATALAEKISKNSPTADRKSTRLNSSHVKSS